MTTAIIRYVLTAVLLGFVWFEAGWATALTLTLLAVRSEVSELLHGWHGDQIRALAKALEAK